MTSWRWPNREKFIDEIVDAYGEVYANLRVHNRAYPSPGELRSKIKWGNVEFEGLHQVSWPGGGCIGRGGSAALAPTHTLQVKLTHQPLHGAAGHGDPFAVQLPPDLAGAVDAESGLGVHPDDLGLEVIVADRSLVDGGRVRAGVK